MNFCCQVIFKKREENSNEIFISGQKYSRLTISFTNFKKLMYNHKNSFMIFENKDEIVEQTTHEIVAKLNSYIIVYIIIMMFIYTYLIKLNVNSPVRNPFFQALKLRAISR